MEIYAVVAHQHHQLLILIIKVYVITRKISQIHIFVLTSKIVRFQFHHTQSNLQIIHHLIIFRLGFLKDQTIKKNGLH